MKRNTILPRKLYEAILSSDLSGKGLNKAIDFIQYLFYKCAVDEEELEGTNFINIPSQSIKSIFTRDYNSLFMDILTSNKIIIRSPFTFGSSDGSKCFGYRINHELMDFSDIEVTDHPSLKESPKPVGEYEYVIKDLQKIEFDIQAMKDYVANLNIRDLIKLNEEITEDPVELTPIFSKIKFKSNKSLKDALALAKRLRKDLVEYDGRCFIVKSDEFVKWKTITKKSSLIHTITKLSNQEFYAGRNETNYRLDTNLTNLDGVFIKNGYLRLSGETLADIDLKNSQPTLLSYVLTGAIFDNEFLQPVLSGYTFPEIDRSQLDYELFIKLAESGLLYDHVAIMLGWKRPQAKKSFIKTMFADKGWPGHSKKLLRELFPTTIQWMDEFKRLNGNTLAVLLQRIESRLFIDHIYMSLREKGYTIFTKHDSILCRESQRAEIKEIMCTMLDTYNFKYRLG